jgi:predicted nuclease with TOPRIM domain
MEKICEERHKRIDEKLNLAETRLNSHSERLDKIEYVNGRLEERLDGLIKQLSSLNTTLKWFIGLMVASFVAFFFYVVQQKII